MAPSGAHRFDARVEIIGINPHVVIDEALVAELLSAAGKRALPVPVAASVNGMPFLANVVRYAGAARLYLDGRTRKQAAVAVGDEVTIELALDAEPRVRPVPLALQAALEAHPDAKARWDALAPSRRKEFVAYIDSLKGEASVAKNVARTIDLLLGGALPYRPAGRSAKEKGPGSARASSRSKRDA